MEFLFHPPPSWYAVGGIQDFNTKFSSFTPFLGHFIQFPQQIIQHLSLFRIVGKGQVAGDIQATGGCQAGGCGIHDGGGAVQAGRVVRDTSAAGDWAVLHDTGGGGRD